MSDWPHQIRGVQETLAAIDGGCRRVCLTAPTGAGKTRMVVRLLEEAAERRWRAVLYTNRKMLSDQVSGVLNDAGIKHGRREAGHEPRLLEDVQVSSLQTELARVYQQERWSLHEAQLVIVDEAHNQKGPQAEKVLTDHVDAGAALVGVTATPLEIGHIYEQIVVAGVNSELRACGALVPAITFGADEPDTRKLKPQVSGEFSENEVRKVMMTKTIHARVLEWFRKINPDCKASILFAPGVPESRWFAHQFDKNGIPAAHIDGEYVSFGKVHSDGEPICYPTTPELRAEVLQMSREGAVKVLCNRFVLREGIDAPWLAHGIFATIFGALTSYLQSGGRLLRAFPGLDSVTIQDHGGHWHRHGSLNADRHWSLEMTNASCAAQRMDALREKRDQEPIRCPECGAIRLSGSRCSTCGFQYAKKMRPVVQTNGTLKEFYGDIYRPRRRAHRTNEIVKKWEGYYFRARNADMSWLQAEALFARENFWHYPPRGLPLMPSDPGGWYRKVRDTPRDQLIPKT